MKNLLFLIVFCLTTGCTSFMEKPLSSPNPLTPQEVQPYFLDLSVFKVEDPNPIFLNKDFDPCEQKNSSFIAFNPTEFRKIVQLKEIQHSQYEVLEKNISLINSYVNQINAAKRLTLLQNRQIEDYFNLYSDCEQQRKREKKEHILDNIINRTTIYLLGILNVVLVVSML